MLAPRAASLLAETPYSARREMMPDRATPSTTRATTTRASTDHVPEIGRLFGVARAHAVEGHAQDQGQEKIEPDEQLPVLRRCPAGDQDGQEQADKNHQEQRGEDPRQHGRDALDPPLLPLHQIGSDHEQGATAEHHDPIHDEGLDVDLDELKHPDRDPDQHRSAQSDQHRVDEHLAGKPNEVQPGAGLAPARPAIQDAQQAGGGRWADAPRSVRRYRKGSRDG